MFLIFRVSDDFSPLPFFLFGDFNFRLDTLSLVQVRYRTEALPIDTVWWCVKYFFLFPDVCLCIQDLSTSAEVQMVMKDSTNELEKIIYEEKGNDHKVCLRDTWNHSGAVRRTAHYNAPVP